MGCSYLNALLVSQFLVCLIAYINCEEDSLLAASVATEETDGYKRYVRSLTKLNYKYEIYGLGEVWNGGDVKLTTGGGQKVNILKRELEKYKEDANKIILFTDSYDVIIVHRPDSVIEKFKSFNARIVFGAEDFCWPDPTLKDDYPVVETNEKRFLNSGGFIGYASDIYDIISSSPIKDDDDDQLFYTKIFLNKELRDKHKIKLDTKSDIFQNLNGAIDEVTIFSEGDDLYIYNNLTETIPAVLHGNGPSKGVLNRLGNYLAKAYSNIDGCIMCNEDLIKLDPEAKNEWPEVTIGIFIEQPTPFLREFFEKIAKLNYPKSKLSVLIHNNVKYHDELVQNFINTNKEEYAGIKILANEDDSPEHEARAEAVKDCLNNNCKYYLSIDCTAHLDNEDALKLLIEQNKPILSPVMIRPGTSWSNVWGAVNDKGYYARSDDYLFIINRDRLGVWNLPFISECVLMSEKFMKSNELVFEDTEVDPTMALSANLRDSNVFMYATNMHEFGHLINPDNFNTTLIRPEMYEIFANIKDWSDRYLHKEYNSVLEGKSELLTPCPDVYWFPVVSDEFCEDLILMMENFGKWSGGRNQNYDERLPGGYENVPTVDIHMRQVDWDKHWLFFLKKFIQPIQQKVFIGYFHDPPSALLSFVVRYRPDEQDHLTPHHDASTYTLNLALNRPTIDFQGGGCRFVRYNCSVLETKKGWGMIHPGRLTHYHEGLKVTGGTRYIMVSFIDP